MNLKILLPHEVFADHGDVTRIVAETSDGSCGILPHRLDCVSALAPGILTWQIEGEDEVYAAVDEGVLIKIGAAVLVSVRRALRGTDRGALREAVTREFLTPDEAERRTRHVVVKLEAGFFRRLAAFRHK